MTQNWALTAAIFILGVFLGYVGRVLVAEIHIEDDYDDELEEAMAKAKSLGPSPTEAAILKNLERNDRR